MRDSVATVVTLTPTIGIVIAATTYFCGCILVRRRHLELVMYRSACIYLERFPRVYCTRYLYFVPRLDR